MSIKKGEKEVNMKKLNKFNEFGFNESEKMAQELLDAIKDNHSCYYLSDILESHLDSAPHDFEGFNTTPAYDGSSGKLIGFAYNYSYLNPDYPGEYEPEYWTSRTVIVRFEDLREILES